MDRFEGLSILGDLFPRLTRTVLLAGLLFYTHTFATGLVSIAAEHGRKIAAEMEAAILPTLRADHPARHLPRHTGRQAPTSTATGLPPSGH